jgi:hypothetical protein
MTMYDMTDLHKRVARYEAALDELRAAHHDIRNVLLDQVLYDRWQQIGIELGFAAPQSAPQQFAAQPDQAAMNQQVPQLSDAWAG